MRLNIKEFLQRIDWLKAIKIAVGFSLALFISQLFSLQYAASAGLIALLSIQSTKKETVKTAITRFVAIAVAFILVYISFSLLGFTVLGFGLFLLLFVPFILGAKLEIALAMSSVIASHFWIEQNLSIEFYLNEAAIFFIGAGLGIFLNLFTPNKINEIRNTQREIEGKIQHTLDTFALVIDQKADVTASQAALADLKAAVTAAQTRIKHHADNTFTTDMGYYIKYVDMRREQVKLLHKVQHVLVKLRFTEEIALHAEIISTFMREISKHMHECNNAERLLQQADSLLEAFRKSDLPKTREEFEARSVLFQIMTDLTFFLAIKNQFASELTPDENLCYWEPQNLDENNS